MCLFNFHKAPPRLLFLKYRYQYLEYILVVLIFECSRTSLITYIGVLLCSMLLAKECLMA